MKVVDDFGFEPQKARELISRGEGDLAIAYMEKFIGQGSVRAMISMADYLFDKKDYAASLAWMERAERTVADDDFVSPIYLASAYERGLGAGSYGEQRRRALQHLERVADSGNLVVMHTLMSYFLYGLNGAPRDRERFMYWASRAADLGSEAAQEALRPGSAVFEDADPEG